MRRNVLLANFLGEKGEHGAGARRVNELDRKTLGDAQSASDGDAVHPRAKHFDAGGRCGRVRSAELAAVRRCPRERAVAMRFGRTVGVSCPNARRVAQIS